jgi:hypothetical protein
MLRRGYLKKSPSRADFRDGLEFQAKTTSAIHRPPSSGKRGLGNAADDSSKRTVKSRKIIEELQAKRRNPSIVSRNSEAISFEWGCGAGRQSHAEGSRLLKSVVRITEQGRVKDMGLQALAEQPDPHDVDARVAVIQVLISLRLKAVAEELQAAPTRLAGPK